MSGARVILLFAGYTRLLTDCHDGRSVEPGYAMRRKFVVFHRGIHADYDGLVSAYASVQNG